MLARASLWCIETSVDDRKAVIATVEPVHELVARARIGGTIASLKVREGDGSRPAPRSPSSPIRSSCCRCRRSTRASSRSRPQRDQAKTDFDRAQRAAAARRLRPRSQLDQARTALDVAERNLAAHAHDREVIEQQAAEGAVLAPGAGRILTVPVSEGRVVLPGETIATLAEDNYILRLQLPERHAQFMRPATGPDRRARPAASAAGRAASRAACASSIPRSRAAGSSPTSRSRGSAIISSASARASMSTTGTREAIVIPRRLCLSAAPASTT